MAGNFRSAPGPRVGLHGPLYYLYSSIVRTLPASKLSAKGTKPMKTGMNLLLWTTHVTAEHDAILEQIESDRLRRGRGPDLRHGRPGPV